MEPFIRFGLDFDMDQLFDDEPAYLSPDTDIYDPRSYYTLLTSGYIL